MSHPTIRLTNSRTESPSNVEHVRIVWGDDRGSEARQFLIHHEDHIRVQVPLTATVGLYYRVKSSETLVSDDPRLLHDGNCEFDAGAVHSLLQFGAPIPPLTPWKQIRRFIPGRTSILRGREVTELSENPAAESDQGVATTNTSLDDQIAQVVSALDDAILQCAESSEQLIVLFSGGVDSGLLAARVASLGLRDAVLVNLSFGREDPESLLAEAMAKHLGLHFIRILNDDTDVSTVLDNAGLLYPSPFCDHSALPTYQLCRAVTERFNRGTILDGTGADGGFGLAVKSDYWKCVHRIPLLLRQFGSRMYAAGTPWLHASRSEYVLRILRRSALLDYPLSAIAQNAFSDIAYFASKPVQNEVRSHSRNWLSGLQVEGHRAKLAVMDLALVCSSIFAQKSRPLFNQSQLRITYPFLSKMVVNLALRSCEWPSASKEPKHLLKTALARHVPREMVYRPKSGFVGPIEKTFKQPAFLSCIDELCSSNSALSGFIKEHFFANLRQVVSKGLPLPAPLSNLLWAGVFTNRWISKYCRDSTRDAGSIR